nr:phosphate/phosphite/phosphonate ABC transporter substrate-binding protein [uncultured Desulfobacter sp.]
MQISITTQGKFVLSAIIILGILSIPGCEETDVYSGPRYGAPKKISTRHAHHFAVHPLYNPARLVEAYQPMINYLNRHLDDDKILLEASWDYADYEAKFKEERISFLLPNPWQTLQGIKNGFEVIAMAGDARDFKGIFIVRKDSPIKTPLDLKGKSVCYPAPTALAACIMPQFFLYRSGLDIHTDIENHYVGSQESSIMNVWLKQHPVAATWPPPWRDFQKNFPEKAAQLKVIWETPHLMNNSVMARKSLPPALKLRVRELLVSLHGSLGGTAILNAMETRRFHKADNESYEMVKSYIETFEQKVRKVKPQ